MTTYRDDILEQAACVADASKGVAIATRVTTWGSSPVPWAVSSPSTKAGHDRLGRGGCIEGAVVHEALAAIRDGKPRLLDFGVHQ
jgi:xanthine/CO dehydrogenase XdhC/CoxF family maturation factor